MYERNRYFAAVAQKVSDWCEKPFAIVVAVAFLFAWIIVTPFTGLSVAGSTIVDMAVAMLILLLVLILQNAHKHDIRSLQARLDMLVSPQHDPAERRDSGELSEAELHQVRDLLKRQTDGDDSASRTSRDSRPSLF